MISYKDYEERNLGLRVGVAVRGYRQFQDLTQAALAEKASISQPEISLIERGRRSNLATLERVSLALGMRLSEMIRFAEDVEDVESVVQEARAFVREQRDKLSKSKESRHGGRSRALRLQKGVA